MKRETTINPSLLLEMDEARLHALKAAMEGFVGEFKKLIGMMDQDLDATRELKRKLQKMEAGNEERKEPDILCIKIGPREHERGHCRCHERKKRRERRHDC